MKKKYLSFFILLVVSLSLVAFSACTDTDKTTSDDDPIVGSLTLLSEHEGAYVIGEDVDLSEITFNANYSDGESKKVVLSDLMLTEEDRQKFFEKGIHTITLRYKEATLPLQIVVREEEVVPEYKVSFFSLGGTSFSPYYTSAVTAFPLPERVGYTFDGWFTGVEFNRDTGLTTYIGSRVRAPYTVRRDTSFYAKWIDNRFCTVSFYGENDTFLFDEKIHYGEAIDVDSYPYADADGNEIQLEGKTFLGWTVTNGNAANVTSDLKVKAGFLVDKCTVSIYYFNKDNKEISVDNSFDYGTEFIYGNYTMPFKEGYNSRWVVYYNHGKSYSCPACGRVENVDYKASPTCPTCGSVMNENGFVELPDDTGVIKLTQKHTLIQAYHVIKTYEVIIRNGQTKTSYVDSSLASIYGTLTGTNAYKNDKERLENEYETFLKNGTIKLESIYADANAKKNFPVDWNGSFDLSKYTQNPKLDTPASVSDGYSAEWCYIVPGGNGEIWYNTKGQIWDETEGAFIEPAARGEGEGENYWLLYNNPDDDTQREYVAVVKNGVLTEIKNNVSVSAKYIKKNRSVAFRREYDSVKGLVVKFSVPFYSSFNLYDPTVYIDPETYVFSPDRSNDTDPAPDPIIREKLALYERVRFYELYRMYTVYDRVLTKTGNSDIAAFYLWLYVNRDEMSKLIRIFGDNVINPEENATYEFLENAVKNEYGLNMFKDNDFRGMFSAFATIVEGFDGENWCESDDLLGVYNRYSSVLFAYGYGYDADLLAANKEKWATLVEEYNKKEYENAWYYFYSTEAYRFYEAQLDRTDVRFEAFDKTDKYKLYLADVSNPDNIIYQRYKSEYDKNNGTSTYVYYSLGLESAESESMRAVKLALIPQWYVEQFYLFAITDEKIKEYSSTYYSASNISDDWSIVWYTSAEKTAASKVSFLQDTASVLTVKDDIILYSTDIDNREYEFTFHYDYDFETTDYRKNSGRKYSASVLWQNIYTDYYVQDATTGVFIPASNVYNEKIKYFAYTADYVESNPIAKQAYESGVWATSYTYYYVSAGSGRFSTAGKTYYDDIVYYSHYSDVTSDITLSMDTILPEKYDDTVSRIVNGVILTYRFTGWYDTPYYTYLVTGHQGESLRVTNSHTENTDFYAHYVCTTEYTVTIYDTTQSNAYNGLRNYADGYAVRDNSISYTVPAGTVLSLDELYKGTQTGNTVLSGQEYYRMKRYIDYFVDYYSADTSLYKNMPKDADGHAFTIESLDAAIEAYERILAEYDAVTSAVKSYRYADYTEDDFKYYMSRFTQMRTKTGDNIVADWYAFVSAYLDMMRDLSVSNYLDVSVFTEELNLFLADGARYKNATEQAKLFNQEGNWSSYYRNYYVLKNGIYTPVLSTDPFSYDEKYYTFMVTSDYDYYRILLTILKKYRIFINSYADCSANATEYAKMPYHKYDRSMADINAANDYDYEGAGDLKFNFINWYTNASYNTLFNGATEKGYYESTDEAWMDQAPWAEVYMNYFTYDNINCRFERASVSGFVPTQTYYEIDYRNASKEAAADFGSGKWDKAHTSYYLYDESLKLFYVADTSYSFGNTYYKKDTGKLFADTEISLSVYNAGLWSDHHNQFFTYDGQKYVTADEVYDSSAVYYAPYKNVTSIIASDLAGWEINYEKYYVYDSVAGAYIKATNVFDSTATYYQYSAMYWELVVSQDISLYAKWMDISRGSEGLVYELVFDETTGENAYIVIDYITAADNVYSNEEYYYVTTNDNGNIPENIVGAGETIELQIPASITSYLVAVPTEDEKENWRNNYQNYYVYNKNTFSYVDAKNVFDENAVYYDKFSPVSYPVIGIKSDALDRFRSSITIVNLPLNLFFIEEGSFNLCPIETFTRAAARSGEQELQYIILDVTTDGFGVAVYQFDRYDHIITCPDGKAVNIPSEKTILAYAVGKTDTSYEIMENTKRIAAYAFRNARVTGIEYDYSALVSIGEFAFDNTALIAFTIASNVEIIGQSAFSRSIYLDRITVQDDSRLTEIGEKAFYGTSWYKAQKGLVRLFWKVNVYSAAPTEYSRNNVYYKYAGGQYIETAVSASDQSDWGNQYVNYYISELRRRAVLVGLNTATAGGYANYDMQSGFLVRYNEDGTENASGDYVAISCEDDSGDRILFYYPEGSVSCTRHSVVLSSDYLYIAKGALKGLEVQRVVLHAPYLAKIDDEAFMNCPLLNELVFVDASDAIAIGQNVFSGKGEKSLTIEDASGLVMGGDGWSEYENIIK